jgi:glycosyltransferase involved in cell wall biosynthesis
VQAAAGREDVTYVGVVEPAEVGALMARAGAVVVPSLWFEGFPITIVEAFSRGRAVVATDLGSLSSIVDDAVGWKFPVGDLANALAAVTPSDLVARGEQARTRYLGEFSPAAVTSALLAVYTDVIGASELDVTSGRG